MSTYNVLFSWAVAGASPFAKCESGSRHFQYASDLPQLLGFGGAPAGGSYYDREIALSFRVITPSAPCEAKPSLLAPRDGECGPSRQ